MSSNKLTYINLLEEPPAGSGKMKSFNTNNWVQNFKDWMIEKIAGDRMIILNAHIVVVPREIDETILGKLALSKGGSLLQGSCFFRNDDYMLQLTNHTELKEREPKPSWLKRNLSKVIFTSALIVSSVVGALTGLGVILPGVQQWAFQMFSQVGL